MLARTRIRTSLAALAAALVAALLAMSLAGCGNNSKQVIGEDLDATLGAFKDPTVESLEEAAVTLGGSQEDADSLGGTFTLLEDEFGIDADELLHALYLDYDYSYSDIVIDGSTATTTVTITTKDYDAASSALQDYVNGTDFVTLVLDAATTAETEEEYNQTVYQALFEELYADLEAADTMATDVEVTYELDGDTWSMTEESADGLASALLSGVTTIFDTESDGDVDVDVDTTDDGTDTDDGTATGDDVVDAGDVDTSPEVEESSPEGAAAQAQTLLKSDHYSYEGLIDMLEFYGYTTEDAMYAADTCGADWTEQADLMAADYMEYVGGLSREELIEQLEYEGFTDEQAEHAADSVGL